MVKQAVVVGDLGNSLIMPSITVDIPMPPGVVAPAPVTPSSAPPAPVLPAPAAPAQE